MVSGRFHGDAVVNVIFYPVDLRQIFLFCKSFMIFVAAVFMCVDVSRLDGAPPFLSTGFDPFKLE